MMSSFFSIIVIICVVLVSHSVQAGLSSYQDWTLYKSKHGKSYESQAENASRFANFMATKQRVERHNVQGNSSFKMGLNHMADWTREERAKLRGVRFDSSLLLNAEAVSSAENVAHLAEILASSSEPVPDEFDWRKVPDRVIAVKYQGLRGSSWAFSAIGSLEGQETVRGLNRTKLEPLSEQELVDCAPWAWGCYGGWMADAFDDIATIGGVQFDKDYPYEGKESKCRFDKNKSVISDKGHVYLPTKDEANLKETLAKFGPISVAMDATEELLDYESGVFNSNVCSSAMEVQNHGVLLVGYGIDRKQGDYWLVKNSWSASWGEQGYFRIKRGVNKCGIALYPTIPRF